MSSGGDPNVVPPNDGPLGSELPRFEFSELRLQRLIGQGGIGRVYRAVHRSSSKTVAVKFLKKRFWKDRVALGSLITEFDAISRIHHSGVVRPLGWGRTPSGTPFIVSELIDGMTLQAWSETRDATMASQLSRLVHVAEALIAVHAAGVVHGDVTPTNLLCDGSGRVVLTDFGLSRLNSQAVWLKAGATLGFAAPEQVNPAFGPVGPWTDIYGFGATAVAVLTGRPPHSGPTRAEMLGSILCGVQLRVSSDLNRRVGADLTSLVTNCVAREAVRRPESMVRVAQQLRAAIDNMPD